MNFIEIDKTHLETVGFKTLSNHCFKHAVRSLRRTRAFVEGTSFEDSNAHFVIKKGPRFKLSIWIREDMLDKWIEIAKHSPHFTKNNGKGLVYFIHEEGDFKRFKIGYTTKISERLLSLQTGNPDLLVVYKTIENVTKKKRNTAAPTVCAVSYQRRMVCN